AASSCFPFRSRRCGGGAVEDVSGSGYPSEGHHSCDLSRLPIPRPSSTGSRGFLLISALNQAHVTNNGSEFIVCVFTV
ncbi:hypothetical protein X975_23583, partial [Stegodyphus mimosarum]